MPKYVLQLGQLWIESMQYGIREQQLPLPIRFAVRLAFAPASYSTLVVTLFVQLGHVMSIGSRNCDKIASSVFEMSLRLLKVPGPNSKLG